MTRAARRSRSLRCVTYWKQSFSGSCRGRRCRDPSFHALHRVAPCSWIVTRSGLTSVTPSSTAWTGSEADPGVTSVTAKLLAIARSRQRGDGGELGILRVAVGRPSSPPRSL
jgi:hypothetical protein